MKRLSTIRARPWRVLLVVVFAWAISGCGVKLVYNNLDRLAHWTADDYMDLDPAQNAFFDAQLDVLLYWHRTTQLPIYARSLLDLDAALADGASVEELFEFRDQLEAWWKSIQEAGLPLGTELLYSATDAQLVQFGEQYEKDTKKYSRPYLKLSPDKRRALWAKEYREGMEYFTGTLTPEQKNIITERRQQFVPDESAWVEYRQRTISELLATIRRRDSFSEFALSLREMAYGRERRYGDAYRTALAANDTLYAAVSVALLNSLNAEQHQHLSKRLREMAQDLIELSTDLPPDVPTAGCLVTCS